MRKLVVWLAKLGLTSQQVALLEPLAQRHRSWFQSSLDDSWDDENLAQATMRSDWEGTEVLRWQVARDKKDKEELALLMKECAKAGIARWRIWLVK